MVTLTDEERSVVKQLVELSSTSVGEGIEHAKGLADLDTAIVRVRAHRQLMWAAETGELNLDEGVIRVLREHLEGAVGALEYEYGALDCIRGGVKGAMSVGEDAEASERETLSHVDEYIAEIKACSSLLGRVHPFWARAKKKVAA